MTQKMKVMSKRGYTLLEVVLAVVIVAIAISATLLIMSKLMSYTGHKGDAIVLSTAVAVSQYALDDVRDISFPPFSGSNPPDLSTNDYNGTNFIPYPIDTSYTFTRNIVAVRDINTANGPGNESGIQARQGVWAGEYYDATDGDSMAGYRNLLKVTVSVYKNGRMYLRTVTYKTRNGNY